MRTFRWGAWMTHFKPRWIVVSEEMSNLNSCAQWGESHLTFLVQKNCWDPITGTGAEPNCLPRVVITSSPNLTLLLSLCILGFLASRDCFPSAQLKWVQIRLTDEPSKYPGQFNTPPSNRNPWVQVWIYEPISAMDNPGCSLQVGECCLTQENK